MLNVNPVLGTWRVFVTGVVEGIHDAVPSEQRHTHVVGVSAQKPPDVTVCVCCVCICVYVCVYICRE